MARLWTRYLGFLTGTILAFVGAAFILGKMREERADLAAEGGFGKLTLSTHSPGLLMVSMGIILMLTTILNHPRIDVADAPVYLTAGVSTAQATRELPPPARWQDSGEEPSEANAPQRSKNIEDPEMGELMQEMGEPASK
jgi:hypothetical protein